MGQGITETLNWFDSLVAKSSMPVDDCAHYVCTTHFAFTPLDDSTHLRCYCMPTGSFFFYTTVRFYASTFLRLTLFLPRWMIPRIYDATVCRLAVLFYTTVRFYASTFLRLTLFLPRWMILRIYDATVCRLAVLFYTTVRFYTFNNGPYQCKIHVRSASIFGEPSAARKFSGLNSA